MRKPARVVWISVALALLLAAGLALVVLDRRFHAEFERRAAAAVAAAGRQGSALVGDDDLRGVPEPLARWIRWSGAVGKPRPSVLRLAHGGRFRPALDQDWRPIRGEYVVTTRRPSFTWYGKISVAPGLSIAAIDAYLAGRGRMQVKALSTVPLVDAQSADVVQSAFGRCLAELSMTPTFFLDRDLARCEQVGPDHVRCRVSDGPLAGDADLHVGPDGALDRIEVMRRFDRGDGRTTLERFTGSFSNPRTWGGRRLGAHLDGAWNLPEGDRHYVAFEVERAAYE